MIDLDLPQIEINIEHTRFPVPDDEAHESTDDFPGLVRAADLIGQLADINYLRKQPALFNEFRETGMSDKLGCCGSSRQLSRFLLPKGAAVYR